MFGLSLDELTSYSEIAKNLVSVVGLAGGLFLLYQWIYARRDRATDILLKLDEQFTAQDMVDARSLVEDDEQWHEFRGTLLKATTPVDEYGASYGPAPGTANDDAKFDSLDKLLRFYVLVLGVREARQVSDSALRTCFRFWLAHYYSPDRRELRIYIEKFYPTLANWLESDRRRTRRGFASSFFGPERFGWYPNKKPSRQELERAMKGRVLVITGAGISAGSGIPTYRGNDGYWRSRNLTTFAKRSAFEAEPALIWQWYNERREAIRQASPNSAHTGLVTLADSAQDFLLVTQNVDDLHERAVKELDERVDDKPHKIVHIHGEIFQSRCTGCDFSTEDDGSVDRTGTVPSCPQCGTRLRPGVVWFDEELDDRQVARVERFLDAGKCDLVLVIGTSATFDYIADWALRGLAKRGLLVEINPERTRLSVAADWALREDAVAGVAKLVS